MRTVGDYDLEGAERVTFFFEFGAAPGGAGAYDTIVYLDGYFDGPPSIKLMSSEVAHFRRSENFRCCAPPYGTGCSEWGTRDDSETRFSTAFVNSMGIPQMRFLLRLEHRPNTFCPGPNKPDKTNYQGPAVEPIDVSIETMSVFTR